MTQAEVENLLIRHSELLSGLKTTVSGLTERVAILERELVGLVENYNAHKHGYIPPPVYGG